MHETNDHLPPWMLELLAEDGLSHHERSQAEAHLRSCGRCTAELEASRSVLAALAALPRFSPSETFAEAVMSRVVLPQPAAAQARARRWLPRTRRGWMMLGGAALAPLAPVTALMAWILSHPLVTADSLTSAGNSWLRDQVWSLVVSAAEATIRSGLFDQAGEVLVRLLSIPGGSLSAAALALAVAIPTSGWALFRLLRTPQGGVTHAN